MKRIVPLILILLLTVTLTGCMGNPTDTPNTDVTTTVPSTTTTTTAVQLTGDEAQQTAEALIKSYHQYANLGMCCSYEISEEDLSKYLTDSQKEAYFGFQYKLTCCATKEDVAAHLLRHFDPSLLTVNTEELLFYDDQQNLYIIITPMGIDPVGNIQVTSYTADLIVATAEYADGDGVVYNAITFTCERVGDDFILKTVR